MARLFGAIPAQNQTKRIRPILTPREKGILLNGTAGKPSFCSQNGVFLVCYIKTVGAIQNKLFFESRSDFNSRLNREMQIMHEAISRRRDFFPGPEIRFGPLMCE